MLKVLQVSSDTNIGGAGKCILTYLKHFDRSKLEVAVVLPKNSMLRAEIDALGIKIFEVDGMADKSLDFGAVKDLVRIFKEFKPDIVHTHASMSARIAARLFGAKVGTDAKIEVLLLKRGENDTWETLVRPGKKLQNVH